MKQSEEKQTAHNRSRSFAVLLLILFAASLFFSYAFLLKEADHECSGDDCPVCAHIIQCERRIHDLTAGTGVLPVVAAFLFFYPDLPLDKFSENPFVYTPVILKTRLNN